MCSRSRIAHRPARKNTRSGKHRHKKYQKYEDFLVSLKGLFRPIRCRRFYRVKRAGILTKTAIIALIRRNRNLLFRKPRKLPEYHTIRTQKPAIGSTDKNSYHKKTHSQDDNIQAS